MNVGIVGASGYSGEILVKLLLGHPQVKLAVVTSRQHAGKSVASVIPSLRGTAAEQLKFSESDPAVLAARADIDLWFLALPHGTAADFAQALLPAGRKVIDLSAGFVLPELTDPKWRKELKLAAAPGCYPTSVLVPLAPLLKSGIIAQDHIVV